MWVHTPRMAAMASRLNIPYPRFTGAEMGELLAFLRSVTARPTGRAGTAPAR
jgi:hypothetical protein